MGLQMSDINMSKYQNVWQVSGPSLDVKDDYMEDIDWNTHMVICFKFIIFSCGTAHLHDISEASLHGGTPLAIALHPQLIPWEVYRPSPSRPHNSAEQRPIRFTQHFICFYHPGAAIHTF